MLCCSAKLDLSVHVCARVPACVLACACLCVCVHSPTVPLSPEVLSTPVHPDLDPFLVGVTSSAEGGLQPLTQVDVDDILADTDAAFVTVTVCDPLLCVGSACSGVLVLSWSGITNFCLKSHTAPRVPTTPLSMRVHMLVRSCHVCLPGPRLWFCFLVPALVNSRRH